MSRMVISAYRPRPGRQQALEQLMRRHHERLRTAGLVTDRPPTVMRAGDGTVLEVVEWFSVDAIAAASKHAKVEALRQQYAELSDVVRLTDIAESGSLAPEFEPLSATADLLPELSP